ncbi:Hcp family type VI secretion system effector [Pseudomonas capsici]|uniref:Hcp family type VI secretion system effector n=1 Tax=Pseudomonas capsici TaxID=2810614 RepID=UPI000E3D55A7|nr:MULTISPECIES: Hcp family type VI secretion system effector [Pseudomonas]MBX8606588.1 Hcp family type VI secretion system effector [Pseudomonas cichorii]MBX8613730.1 Hcp family type VI secretion system effector [Pseudomonas cichorii]MCV4289159.1 Hcp family type VI secretion system effector [Pseudomonas capsici]MCV4342079.1 Hcp family type VI secretion system effector [Pseudomonas capsici]GFM51301.1 secreted protein Hcp [Pseudomonas cichorii]
MATPVYMSIKGSRQGLITEKASTFESIGNIYKKEHENQIMVQAVSHVVTVPCDLQLSQPAGTRIHKPLCITKIFDKSSPMLQAALAAGENLPEVEIHWYRIADGVLEHYYTTTLVDAVIVEIKDYMLNNQDSSNAGHAHLQDVHFTYRKITWDHLKAKSSGSDDLRAPVIA